VLARAEMEGKVWGLGQVRSGGWDLIAGEMGWATRIDTDSAVVV